MRRFYWILGLVPAAAVIAGLAEPSRSGAQEIAVETKLVAREGAEWDNFGTAVAIAGDVMVVAAPGADVGGVETSGAVYVFLRDPTGGEWVEHQHLLPASGNFGDNHGELPLAIDGETIVVGAPNTTMVSDEEGVVYVFERRRGWPRPVGRGRLVSRPWRGR
jgi:hypothetical protein